MPHSAQLLDRKTPVEIPCFSGKVIRRWRFVKFYRFICHRLVVLSGNIVILLEKSLWLNLSSHFTWSHVLFLHSETNLEDKIPILQPLLEPILQANFLPLKSAACYVVPVNIHSGHFPPFSRKIWRANWNWWLPLGHVRKFFGRKGWAYLLTKYDKVW